MNVKSDLMSTPFFIIGNPRSGTTLLRLMLTSHPSLVVPPEGGFAIHLHSMYRDFSGDISHIEEFVMDVLAAKKMEEWGLSKDGLVQHIIENEPCNYRDLVALVYEFYSLSLGWEIEMWGDKNNYYLHHIVELQEIFPQAKFIHIVRDGRDVACSYRDLATTTGKYAPQLPNSVTSAAYQWKENLAKIIGSFAAIGLENVYEIRYEDLVLNAESELTNLCDFLGVKYSSEMMKYNELNRKLELEPEIYLRWKQKTNEGLDSSRVNRWKTGMFAEDAFIFEKIAGDYLIRYRYPLSDYHTKIDVEELRMIISK